MSNSYEEVSKEASKQGMKKRFGDCVSENDAALLLGYSSGDALRKQHSKILPYRRIGNRRFYSLADIAALLGRKFPH